MTYIVTGMNYSVEEVEEVENLYVTNSRIELNFLKLSQRNYGYLTVEFWDNGKKICDCAFNELDTINI